MAINPNDVTIIGKPSKYAAADVIYNGRTYHFHKLKVALPPYPDPNGGPYMLIGLWIPDPPSRPKGQPVQVNGIRCPDCRVMWQEGHNVTVIVVFDEAFDEECDENPRFTEIS